MNEITHTLEFDYEGVVKFRVECDYRGRDERCARLVRLRSVTSDDHAATAAFLGYPEASTPTGLAAALAAAEDGWVDEIECAMQNFLYGEALAAADPS